MASLRSHYLQVTMGIRTQMYLPSTLYVNVLVNWIMRQETDSFPRLPDNSLCVFRLVLSLFFLVSISSSHQAPFPLTGFEPLIDYQLK